MIIKYKKLILVIKFSSYPLEFNPNKQEITKKVLDRGYIFKSLYSFYIKTYNKKKYTLKLNPQQDRLQEIKKLVYHYLE